MVTRFKIKAERAREFAENCSRNIAPQKYYLHNGRQGGQGWAINKLTHLEYEVTINDDKLATLLILKWG